MKSRIAVVSSHPIQYHAAWFSAMAASPDLDLEVLFCHQATAREQGAAGFGVEFEWDVPLFDGYSYRFLKNVAPSPTLSSFRGLDTPELATIIAENRYHAVIVNGWHYKSAWQAIRACWQTKTPVMARGDSHLHSPRNALKKMLKSVPYRWFIPKFDACLAAGKWSSDYFAHYGADREKIFLVPHTIDEGRFLMQRERLQRSRKELRERWHLSQDDIVFLFSAKFIQKKRPMDFVRAIHIAACGSKHIKGLMVGDGPRREDCERIVAETGAPVRFAGFLNQSEIAPAYVACDALVLPSDGGETWGLVVNEAMTMGRACIVSDHVGCGPDLVTPCETGFVFPLGDVQALANVMLMCGSDPHGLERMGGRAQDRVRRYSTCVAVQGVVDAVAAITAANGSTCG
jgi:glycosyltransferase involved in cell wall biosynthesis